MPKKVVVQTGGPYRSLVLKSHDRRKQLIKEIDFLENVELWQRSARLRGVPPRRRSIYLLPIASTVLLMSVFLVFSLATGDFLVAMCIAPTLMVVLARWRYDFYLWLRWRHGDDPEPLLRQKLAEIRELPPE